jgi:folate-binding protein YgfZ
MTELTAVASRPIIGYPIFEAGNLSNFYAPLEQDALLHISGPDALKFLQGQVTCDTRKIDSTHAVPGAYCTPQGRTVCDFLLCELGPEHIALRMRRDLREHSAAVFGKYIIFSKAQVQPQREDWLSLAFWGSDSAASLNTLFGQLPQRQYDCCSGAGFVLIQVDENARQFECFINPSLCATSLQDIANAMQPGHEPDWQALQIAAGIGRIEAATTEEFIPQMLNYDLTGHISFDKGCYTGQEVVARLHYRGKSKRRMYLTVLPEVATAGDALYSSDSAQSVGNVVNVAASSGGQLRALVIATVSRSGKNLHLGSEQGPTLTLSPPPYNLGAE